MAARLHGFHPRVRGVRMVAAVLVGVLLAGLGGWWLATPAIPDGPSVHTEDRLLTVPGGPGGPRDIRLDTRLYVPEAATERPAPAVLLPHGFGGDKRAVEEDAEELATQGYVVLTWTARGFGVSEGQIHLNSPDHEVADAQRLLDWLSQRPEVRQDQPGDPRVGVVGGSYGGALALSLAGLDQRVDALVPQMTWHNLGRALFPEATGDGPKQGVFKQAWAGGMFGAAITPGQASGGAFPGAGATKPYATGSEPGCGRFAQRVCHMYQTVAASGRATEEAKRLLWRASPASVIDQVQAPTLLVQGTADTLFPLRHADANARGIARGGTPVQVEWSSGGHSDAGSESDAHRMRELTAGWLDHYLRGNGPKPDDSFGFSRVSGYDYEAASVRTVTSIAESYPGLRGTSRQRIPLGGHPNQISNPPGGTPAAISSLPGLSAGAAIAGGSAPRGSLPVGTDIPGQSIYYQSQPFVEPVDVVGSPTVRLKAASESGEAVLFLKLYDVSDGSAVRLLGGQVAPVRLTDLPASIDEAQGVRVRLPALAHRFAPGHRLRVMIAAADQAYAGPTKAHTYEVGIGDNAISVPDVEAEAMPSPAGPWLLGLGGLLLAIGLGVAGTWVVARRRTRSREHRVVEEYADIPLVVRGLGKAYPDLTALHSVDFEVHRGQVVGLLGANGAGKTTTLRTLLGLITPTHGDLWIFGHRVVPGALSLARLGALVEGPGFLPHLTGRRNLELYWRSTGAPEAAARLPQVLEIAGLGAAVDRRVRTYSHGMRQRLAIAQAMLGLPELLVLDEPTDGLDPPQIAEMRAVLRRYAEDGRAVLVSSHLLAEVEQTCSHVVVLHQGHKVASGPVAEVAGESQAVVVQVSDPGRAEEVLADLAGVRSVARQNGSLVVDLDGLSRAGLIRTLVGAELEVDGVVPRRRLEDAFLALVGES